MTTDNAKWADTLIHLFAVASRLEGEGQYNLAKLTRAAADSLCRQETHPLIIPSDKDKLTAEVQKVIEALTSMNMSADLLSALKQGSEFMAQGKLSPITATPHPYVCRSCGYVTLSPPAEPCPKCGAFAETFQKFMPNYWFDALHPEAARERLRQTPLVVEKLIEGLSDDVMNQSPSDGGWAIRNTLSHLRDAQGVLDFRVDLFLKEAHPILESKAVFAWAKNEAERPPSARDIFETYKASRAETLRKLESLAPSDWDRVGEHEEFGAITLRQQVSYFAAHEATHLSQIEALIQ
ncbi:MAG: DinB family protein [Anaerolineaceae bacterium]|nr:DinB family protein [Anaerolineaceae bacterium]